MYNPLDYFCHLAIAPEFYPKLVDVDKEFTETPYFHKMSWLKNENDDLYDPKHTDLLRVAFTSTFDRGVGVDSKLVRSQNVLDFGYALYLKLRSQGQYNQIANYVYTQSEINIRIGKRAPNDYVKAVEAQCEGGKAKYGGIDDAGMLEENLRANCVPGGVGEMTVEEYPGFLEARRKMMAAKVRDYYFSL